MTSEVLLEPGPTGWSARFAVRIDSAVDLTKLVGYAELDPEQRAERAYQEDVGYLSRLSTEDSRSAFEFRWLATPDGGTSLVLLGRIHRTSRAEAQADGFRVRARLAELPTHVKGEPLTDAGDVATAFAPFRAHPLGIAEIRRPCVQAVPRRPDAGVRRYLAVPPLLPDSRSSAALLRLLAGAGTTVAVSTGVEPVQIGPDLPRMLSVVADDYGRLGRPGEFSSAGGLYSAPVWLAADPFAVTAERLYRDAANRYAGSLYRLRITVASTEPPVDDLAAAVADLLGRGPREAFPGWSCVVEQPRRAIDAGLLLDSFVALGVPRWGGDRVWQSGPVPSSLRQLCELADPAQAACATWLPAAATGSLTGFPTVEPDPDQRHASAGVHFTGATVTIEGDVTGSKHVHGPAGHEPVT